MGRDQFFAKSPRMCVASDRMLVRGLHRRIGLAPERSDQSGLETRTTAENRYTAQAPLLHINWRICTQNGSFVDQSPPKAGRVADARQREAALPDLPNTRAKIVSTCLRW